MRVVKILAVAVMMTTSIVVGVAGAASAETSSMVQPSRWCC